METHKNENKIIEKSNFFEKKFFTPLLETLARFPLAITLFTINVIFISYHIFQENFHNIDEIFIFKTSISLVIAGILSISASLSAEKKNNKILHIFQVFPLIYGIFIFSTFDFSHTFTTSIIMQIIAFILLIFAISSNKNHDSTFFNHFRKTLSAMGLATIVGFTSGLLGMIALLAVQGLFDLDYTFSKNIAIWWTISLGLFAPTFALANFSKIQENQENFETQKIWDFFTKFLFVPFTTIYFVILYAYSVKVLANFSDWPKGIIASLVMGFSFLGYFSYILTRNSENATIKIFRKILPWAIFFQIFMLFYAIFLRIAQYGLTTSRYIIVLAGTTLFAISVYFIASKRKNLVIIPASFSLVALIFSFWPWGVYNLPQKLQFEDFMKKAQEYQIFDGEKFIKNTNLTLEQSSEIREKIYYLCDYASNCAILDRFLPAEIQKLERSHEKQNYIFSEIGLEERRDFSYNNSTRLGFWLKNHSYNLYEITNFDYLIHLNNHYLKTDWDIYLNDNNLIIIHKNEKIFEKNIEAILTELYNHNQWKSVDYYTYITMEKPLIIDFENENFLTKIFLENFTIHHENEKTKLEIHNNDINMKIFLKDKNNLLDAKK